MTTAEAGWSKRELAVLGKLTSPERIQAFLDQVPYSSDPIYRSPRSVLRDRKAHCFDGAMFASCALDRIGYPPMLVDLRAVRDDDHIIAVYRRGKGWGALAKSNFVGLRFREPVYRDLRELVMSYFEVYYNVEGEKTLRSHSVPVDLRRLEKLGWRFRDEAMDVIAVRLDAARHVPLVTEAQARTFARMDERSLQAGLLGVNAAGLYKPGKKG